LVDNAITISGIFEGKNTIIMIVHHFNGAYFHVFIEARSIE